MTEPSTWSPARGVVGVTTEPNAVTTMADNSVNALILQSELVMVFIAFDEVVVEIAHGREATVVVVRI